MADAGGGPTLKATRVLSAGPATEMESLGADLFRLGYLSTCPLCGGRLKRRKNMPPKGACYMTRPTHGEMICRYPQRAAKLRARAAQRKGG